MKVKALKGFRDLKAGKIDRKAGDIFEVTQERYREIVSALPSWIEAVPESKPEPKPEPKKVA